MEIFSFIENKFLKIGNVFSETWVFVYFTEAKFDNIVYRLDVRSLMTAMVGPYCTKPPYPVMHRWCSTWWCIRKCSNLTSQLQTTTGEMHYFTGIYLLFFFKISRWQIKNVHRKNWFLFLYNLLLLEMRAHYPEFEEILTLGKEL